MANYPEVVLIVLLIDERPEEVTQMERSVKGQVIASLLTRSQKIICEWPNLLLSEPNV